MKPRYLGFRVLYLLQTKLGFLKIRFPVNPNFKHFITKEEWLKLNIPFFNLENNDKKCDTELGNLKEKAEKILQHTFTFFSSTEYELGSDNNWHLNPDSGYQYNRALHWSEIADLSEEAGDIKYVWEKARFTFIYDLIRYEFHYQKNSAEFIFKQIESFIDSNPINQGPHYKCSQEISLRILNWSYVLFYYKYSPILTNELFRKIVNSIYWQLKHVYGNINFSRIAVRNNHAITETAMLYLSNLLFPFIKETRTWSAKGKRWLLMEIDYQIYSDGSYLQFSHNYHRVVVQTLCWVLRLNQLHKITFPKRTIDRLTSTLDFLFQHQDSETGWLPNYGNNDGALFFPMNNMHYRDFRPQLQVLARLLGKELYEQNFEDSYWFGIQNVNSKVNSLTRKNVIEYNKGGFFGFRDTESLTTLRCGSYKNRPYQADALHLDIWYQGVNILFDPGTYKYNTKQKYLNFYNGTKGHNTLSIGGYDQMLKGGRFIWYFWTKKAQATVQEFTNRYEFSGEITGFPLYGKGIKHNRTVIKNKDKPVWRIIDRTNYRGSEKVFVHWNINSEVLGKLDIKAVDSEGMALNFKMETGWDSEIYGMKKEFKQLVCIVKDGYCETTLTLQ